MDELLEPGQKVEYLSGDKWLDGTVHAVKKHEDSKGSVTYIGYLIDTGNHERLQEWQTNQRDDVINERIGKILKGDETHDELRAVINKVSNAKDLPESKMVDHSFRQPEQIEVSRDSVRAI